MPTYNLTGSFRLENTIPFILFCKKVLCLTSLYQSIVAQGADVSSAVALAVVSLLLECAGSCLQRYRHRQGCSGL